MKTKKHDIPFALNTLREIDIDGVPIKGSLTAIDFPTTAEVRMYPEERRLQIEFRYPDDGKETAVVKSSHKQGTTLYRGAHSGRLTRIEIEGIAAEYQEKFIPRALELAIDALNAYAQQLRTKTPRMHWLNHVVARDFLAQMKEEDLV